jgi:hypothetical protein
MTVHVGGVLGTPSALRRMPTTRRASPARRRNTSVVPEPASGWRKTATT